MSRPKAGMTVSKFIIVRGLVKATLSLLVIGALCAAILIPSGVTEGNIGLLAGLAGVILQHYFQKDTDSPVDNGTKETEENEL